MPIDAGAVALEIVPDLKNFGRDLERGIQSSAKRVGGTLQKTGAIATGLVTAPILAGFKKASDSASDLNESVNAVNVVFGEASNKIHDFAKIASGEAGLSARAFNELVTPIGASLQNVGFGADEAADASINLAKRAADLASVYNVDVSEALSAIQSGLRGEADPLEKFGVLMTDAAVTAHGLEIGLAGADGQLDANAKAQARLSLLMKDSNKVAGDYKNTIGDAANAQRDAAADAENLAATFGQKLLPAKQKAIELASGLLDRFSSLSPSMQTAAVATAGVAAAAGPAAIAVGSMMKATGNIIEHGPKVVSAIGGMGSKMLALGSSALTGAAHVASSFASMVAAAAQATARVVAQIAVQIGRWVVLGVQSLIHAAKVAAAWLISMGPIALVIAAVVGLVVLIVKNWDTIKKVISAGWEWVKRTTEAVWNAVTRFLSGLWDGIVRTAKRTFDAIKAYFEFVLGVYKIIFTRAWSAIRDFVTGLWTRLRDFAVTVFTSLKDRVVALFARLRDGARDAMTTARDWVVERFQSLRDKAAGWIQSLVEYVVGFPDRIVRGLRNIRSKLVQVGRDLIGGLIRGATEFVKKIPGMIADAVKGIAGGVVTQLGRLNPFGDGYGVGGKPPAGYKAMFGAIKAAFPNARLISGYRPGAVTSTGNLSYHARGRAVDFDASRAMALHVNRNFMAQTKELITPWQDLNIWNGRRHAYRDSIMALHDGRIGIRHNHWAMATGGFMAEPVTLERVTMAEKHPEIVSPVPMLRNIFRSELERSGSGLNPGDPVVLFVPELGGRLEGYVADGADARIAAHARDLQHRTRAGG